MKIASSCSSVTADSFFLKDFFLNGFSIPVKNRVAYFMSLGLAYNTNITKRAMA